MIFFCYFFLLRYHRSRWVISVSIHSFSIIAHAKLRSLTSTPHVQTPSTSRSLIPRRIFSERSCFFRRGMRSMESFVAPQASIPTVYNTFSTVSMLVRASVPPSTVYAHQIHLCRVYVPVFSTRSLLQSRPPIQSKADSSCTMAI